MQPARTLWEKVAASAKPVPARYEDGLRVPLDAVVPLHYAAPLSSFFDAPETLWANPWSPQGWSFAAQRFLESPLAHPRARIAAGDPHATELGAFGIASLHYTPAGLLSCARQRFAAVGTPRRTFVRLNDPLPPGVDAVDIALHLLREAGPAGYAGAVLEFGGDGLAALSPTARRRLLAAAAFTGCLTALAAPGNDMEAHWALEGYAAVPISRGWRGICSDEGALHDELVVVNASSIESLLLLPGGAETAPVAGLAGRPIQRVLVGGCIGGDLETLETTLAQLEESPPQSGVDVYLVPASHRLLSEAISRGWSQRAQAARCILASPAQLPSDATATLASTPCLSGTALVASPSTLIASAQAGRLAPVLGGLS